MTTPPDGRTAKNTTGQVGSPMDNFTQSTQEKCVERDRLAEIEAKLTGGWWSAIDGGQHIHNGRMMDDFVWLIARVRELDGRCA